MEFIERLPLVKLHYLLSLSFKEYKPLDKSSSKNDDERRKNYNKMINICESFIKANGTIKRLYKFTGDNNWTESGEGTGRLFAVGNGIQGLPKKIRGFLLDGITSDIDMVNAHPVILRYLCRIHNLPHKELDFYIENRDDILSQFPDRDTAKTLFLKATNDDTLNKKEKNPVFKAYDKEMKSTQKLITQLTCYKNIVAEVPSNKLYNWSGSAMNRILCFYENKILQVIISELNKKKFEICAPMFDGVMPYELIDEDFLIETQRIINETFPSLDMRLSLKEHAKDIVMPEDFKIPEIPKVVETDLNTFEKVSTEFEKTHCKIINKSIFVNKTTDQVIILSRQQIKTSYEHKTYQKLKVSADETEYIIIEENFINDWLINNPSQLCYNDIGCYPTGIECPKNYFNSWIPFEMESVVEYQPKLEALEIVKNHIKILCNHEQVIYDYFIAWIAQMIQYPAVKSICPTLISKQGAGKGTLLLLIRKMLGTEKVFETATPSRDIWGDFNGKMAHTFFVNLNELSKKETFESEGRIKALITDPKLTINNKGVSQYEIDSYHRFLITTNNTEPINTSEDDRRNLIIRSSDEKIGNKEYFDTLREHINDVNVIKTCYEYFKSIPDMVNFHKIPFPCTEYQTNLKELNKSPIESWLEQLVYDNWNVESVELSGKDAYVSFKLFCESKGITYEVNAVKLGVRLNNIKIDGVEKGKHTKYGATKLFIISRLKTHFKLGFVKMEMSDDKGLPIPDDMKLDYDSS